MIFLLLINDEADKRKFVVIYEKYRYLMLAVAYGVLKNYHDSEDVVHDAFVKIAMNMNKVGEPTERKTRNYLVVITKHIAVDYYRKKQLKSGKEIFFEDVGLMEIPLTYIENATDYEILDTLRGLPQVCKDIFLLKYSARYDNKSIAEAIGISERAVRDWIVKGKDILEKKLNAGE